MSFSNFICIFTMSDEVLFDYYSNTKLSESSDMAKSWTAWLVQVTGSAACQSKSFLLLKIL